MPGTITHAISLVTAPDLQYSTSPYRVGYLPLSDRDGAHAVQYEVVETLERPVLAVCDPSLKLTAVLLTCCRAARAHAGIGVISTVAHNDHNVLVLCRLQCAYAPNLCGSSLMQLYTL